MECQAWNGMLRHFRAECRRTTVTDTVATFSFTKTIPPPCAIMLRFFAQHKRYAAIVWQHSNLVQAGPTQCRRRVESKKSKSRSACRTSGAIRAENTTPESPNQKIRNERNQTKPFPSKSHSKNIFASHIWSKYVVCTMSART